MWFEYFTEPIGAPTVSEAMASGPRRVEAVRRGQGRARRLRGNRTNFYSVTASGNSKGAMEYVNALIDAGNVPAVAGIETQLEGTKNAMFAKYAFGVRR
jgi:hypothetical protein